MRIDVEKLRFTFPDDWTVIKFDDSVFYRTQFSKMWQPIKSVDLIVVTPDGIAYLIEVKDYRIGIDAAPSDLPQIVAKKVFDSLAAQIPCKLNANDQVEQDVARTVCHCRSLHVVLHLEQPQRNTGIFRPFDRANLQLKIRQLLKPIHAHPLVMQMGQTENRGWAVRGR